MTRTEGRIYGIVLYDQYDFFMSYSRDVFTAIVDPVINALQSYGLRIWLDNTDVILGCDIHDNLEKVLDLSTKWHGAIVVLDSSYFRKEWCLKELDFFLKHKVNLIPIYYCLKKENIPTEYSVLNRLNRVSIPCNSNMNIAVKKVLTTFLNKLKLAGELKITHTEIWSSLVYSFLTSDITSAQSLITADSIAMFLQYNIRNGDSANKSNAFSLIKIIHRQLQVYFETGVYDMFDQKNVFIATNKLITQVNQGHEYL